MTEPEADHDTAPPAEGNVDVELGDETRALLIKGDLDAAKARYDHRSKPAEDDERVTGDLGGSGDEQAGGAG